MLPENKRLIVILIFIGLIVTLAFNIGYGVSLSRSWERCEMFDELARPDVAGIYYIEEKYFCVWTEGKSFKNINNTYYHEACHAFVNRQPEHFCNDRIMDMIEDGTT